MTRNFLPIALLATGAMMMASCLSDDDDITNITYYNDTAITSFSLGTLTRTYLCNNGDTIRKTYDQATDSTTTVDASTYTFTIDQLKHEIYNTDSLPAGTDVSKAVCTVASKNSGIIAVRRIDSDTLDFYRSTDSLDLTKPREFRVYSSDGTTYRKYTVSLRVHKELADSFVWNSQNIGEASITAEAKGTRLVSNGDRIFAVISGNGSSAFFSKSISANGGWTALGSNLNRTFSAEAYKNVAALNGWIYLFDGGELLKSKDAENWQKAETGSAQLKQLVGASGNKLYALTAEGMASSADGTVWTEAKLDGNSSKLPQGRVSLCTLPLKTNADDARIVMAGNANGADSTAAVWGKIEENGATADAYSWSLYEGGEKYLLPDMEGITMIRYDGKLLAIGGKGLGGSSAQPYAHLYESTDQGLTWHVSSLFSLPADFSRNAEACAVDMAADNDNNVWLIDAKAGKTWKMRINRLGWKEEKKAFNE